MKKLFLPLFAACVFTALPHETLTTTVLFDREIVRILDKHCVMCHVDNGPSFPLATYEQTWLKKREVRAAAIARHMPPWAAFPGYGQFANDNSLTLRESQFVISWVEGLGPRNAGTVFTNVSDPDAPRPKQVSAHVDFGHWQLGEPSLTRTLPPQTIDAQHPDEVRRIVIDASLTSERRVRALEYMPGDRRVVRAAFFTIQETGQWIGSWTPWYGAVNLPKGVAYKLPAGSHIVAEIHYHGAKERVVDQGKLGLFFSDQPTPNIVTDIVLDAKGTQRVRAASKLLSDSNVLALRPELPPGIKSLEVSARKPDGSTEIMLFAKDIPLAWPTPYLYKEPLALPRGTELSVTAYLETPGDVRLTISTYRPR